MKKHSPHWSRPQLLLAFRLYCQEPFGRLHTRNPAVEELARLIGRTPSAVVLKAVNLASLDPFHRARVQGAGDAGPRIQRHGHGSAEREQDAEVGYADPAGVVEQHVRGPEVGVQDAAPVGVVQGAGDLQRGSDAVADGHRRDGIERTAGAMLRRVPQERR